MHWISPRCWASVSPFRGGLIHYANPSAPEILRRLEELTIRLDLGLLPTELLKRLAAMKKPIECNRKKPDRHGPALSPQWSTDYAYV